MKTVAPDDAELFRLPCACATLRRATRAVTQVYENAFRPVGLTAPQFTVLAVLAGMGEMNQGKLGELLAMDSTTLTRVLRIMLNRGLVTAKPGADRREKYLTLTAGGQQLFEQAKPLWLDIQDKVREAFGTAEWGKLMALVDRVTVGARHVAAT